MRITQITVSYGETQSLPEYSNVKPNLTLTATVDEDELPEAVEAELWAHAKHAVHAQIDAALEANDRAAKYDLAPRYQVMRTYWNQWDHRGEAKPPQYVIILPNEINVDREAYGQKLVHTGYPESRKLRLPHAQRLAQTTLGENEGYTLLDCSDGDLSRLEVALGVPEPVAERPFDEEDARAQEHTSPEYQAAMGVEPEVEFDEEFEDEDDEDE